MSLIDGPLRLLSSVDFPPPLLITPPSIKSYRSIMIRTRRKLNCFLIKQFISTNHLPLALLFYRKFANKHTPFYQHLLLLKNGKNGHPLLLTPPSIRDTRVFIYSKTTKGAITGRNNQIRSRQGMWQNI